MPKDGVISSIPIIWVRGEMIKEKIIVLGPKLSLSLNCIWTGLAQRYGSLTKGQAHQNRCRQPEPTRGDSRSTEYGPML